MEASRSFADLKKGASNARCRQCGEPAAATMSLTLRKLSGGQGSNGLAHSKWRFCEAHAVEAFEKINRAYPGGE